MKVSARFAIEVSTVERMALEVNKRLDELQPGVEWEINIIIDGDHAEVQAFWIQKPETYGEVIEPVPHHKVVVSPTEPKAKIAKQWETKPKKGSK